MQHCSPWFIFSWTLGWRLQGVFAPGTFPELGLPGDWYGAVEFQYPPHLRQGAYEEEGRCINTLKVSNSVNHARSWTMEPQGATWRALYASRWFVVTPCLHAAYLPAGWHRNSRPVGHSQPRLRL